VGGLRQADDDLLDVLLFDDLGQILDVAQHRQPHDAFGAGSVGGRIREAHHLVAQAGSLLHLLKDHPADLAGAHDEHAFLADAAALQAALDPAVERTADGDGDHRSGPRHHDHRSLVFQRVAQREGDERHRDQRRDGHRADKPVDLIEQQRGMAAVIELVEEEDEHRAGGLDRRGRQVVSERANFIPARPEADQVRDEEGEAAHEEIDQHQAQAEQHAGPPHGVVLPYCPRNRRTVRSAQPKTATPPRISQSSQKGVVAL